MDLLGISKKKRWSGSEINHRIFLVFVYRRLSRLYVNRFISSTSVVLQNDYHFFFYQVLGFAAEFFSS